MKKNSPPSQSQKGVDKPTSPRLTLRFQSIKSKDDENPNIPKVTDPSSNPVKYPSYCVTMEAKGDVYETQKNENETVTSTEMSVDSTEEDNSSKTNAPSKDVSEQMSDKSAADPGEETVGSSSTIIEKESEIVPAKILTGRLSSDSAMKNREYSSDTEKDESHRKRRKSSDCVQSRHLSIGHVSALKSLKKSLSKPLEGQSEPKTSPKAKKKEHASSSDTESDPEMPNIMGPNPLAPMSTTNGLFIAGSLKVPPLKIVLPPGSNAMELELRERCKVTLSKLALPYVVNPTESNEASGSEASNSSLPSELNKDSAKSNNEASSKPKEDGHQPEERIQRVTRSSQRIQAAQTGTNPVQSQPCDSSNSAWSNAPKTEMSGESSNEDQLHIGLNIHPRKRKLKTKDGPNNESTNSNPVPTSSGSSCNEDFQLLQQQQPQQQQQQILLNSYQMYLNIRKQVDKRRKSMFVVHPKPPQGFKDYLLNRCSYVLEGNAASRLSVPMIPPPQSLKGSIKDLFIQQEKERYRLRLQHLIEREKLVLSTEQEILRVHGRAARAVANQSVPLSVCSILKDEEIYNVLDDDKDKNIRSRFNGRLFLSWLKDIDDKWEKIKEAMLLRHHNEAESLHAVQKLDWEWKMKELAMCDMKTTPVIDDISVPIVHVSDDFDLLPA